ncbi:unnamed protein product [Victoria cruziana]
MNLTVENLLLQVANFNIRSLTFFLPEKKDRRSVICRHKFRYNWTADQVLLGISEWLAATPIQMILLQLPISRWHVILRFSFGVKFSLHRSIIQHRRRGN